MMEVAAALGFESSSEGVRSSGVNKVRKGRGTNSRSEKLLARGNWTNVPLTLLIRATWVTHVLRGGDHVKSWVNIIMYHGMWNGLSGKRQKFR